MSLMNALNSGVSGLSAFQTKMDVIGNNIANVETIGFKSSRVTFSAMLSEEIGSGSGPNSSAQIGLGVDVAAISRNFSQGGIQTTGRETDLAIQGDGFFMVADEGQNYLTRVGSFAFNKNGYLVTQGGARVQGFNASNGEILASGVPKDIQIDLNDVSEPKATQDIFVSGNLSADTSTAKIFQTQLALTTDSGAIATGSTTIKKLAQTTNLDSGDSEQIKFNISYKEGGTSKSKSFTFSESNSINDIISTINSDSQVGDEVSASLVDGIIVMRSDELGQNQLSVNVTNVNVNGDDQINFPNFQVTQQGETNSQTISSTVYDSLGNAHTLIMELTQTDTNEWSYDASFLDGEKITGGPNAGTGIIEFDEAGNLTSDSTLDITFEPGSGADKMSFDVNLGNPESGSVLTQYAGTSSAQVSSQDGYGQGELIDFNIDNGGHIDGIYSNGQTITLGQIAIADVANTHGLDAEGNGLFSSTTTSGEVSVNTASELTNTSLQSSALESSNVDLASQFTNMITAQRAFQANARVITTADTLLQTVVNLKR